MRLSAMMRLVLEEMGEDIIAAILLDARTAMDIDVSRKAVFIQTIDKCYQRLVKLRLGDAQIRHGGEWLPFGEGGEAERATFDGIDIKAVDGVDVVQRCPERGKKTDTMGNERLLRKLKTGLVQPEIGQPVIAR